ncbi:hypothetical protein pipiens_015479 [Culex pipiens pipiens]|uniref:Small ribosomal subunit protein eS6 n=1 Tax=Culex pipiens pipiens TaxID=38569 RepID=A0ABD1CQI1_CULPP
MVPQKPAGFATKQLINASTLESSVLSGVVPDVHWELRRKSNSTVTRPYQWKTAGGNLAALRGKIRGLTDTTMPRRLGLKRATNIRKLYNLAKFVVKYPLPEEDGKKAKSKTPKIQRLITLVVLQGKKHRLAKKKRCVTTKYMKVLALRRRSVSAAGPDCFNA